MLIESDIDMILMETVMFNRKQLEMNANVFMGIYAKPLINLKPSC